MGSTPIAATNLHPCPLAKGKYKDKRSGLCRPARVKSNLICDFASACCPYLRVRVKIAPARGVVRQEGKPESS